jgi:hypothetical protein
MVKGVKNNIRGWSTKNNKLVKSVTIRRELRLKRVGRVPRMNKVEG